MAIIDVLVALGAPVDNPVAVATFIGQLSLDGREKARLLRGYLREVRQALSTDVLVAARDYSFFL